MRVRNYREHESFGDSESTPTRRSPSLDGCTFICTSSDRKEVSKPPPRQSTVSSTLGKQNRRNLGFGLENAGLSIFDNSFQIRK